MACTKGVPASLLTTILLRRSTRLSRSRTSWSRRRTFFPNPLATSTSKPEVLTATRIVPYPAAPIYSIISDVSSYSSFLPLVQSSTVTKLSSPDSTGKRWPEEATLTIGYSGSSSPIPISESFTSRLYCSPSERVVEAVSGPEAETTLSGPSIAHHGPRPAEHESDPSRVATALSFLRTRWAVRAFPFRPGPLRADQDPLEHTGGDAAPPREQTEVVLSIEYRFANPLYAALGGAAAPKVAEWMVKAFEARLVELLHRGAGEGGTYKS